MPSSYNRRHGFGIGAACAALSVGCLSFALRGYWLDAVLLYVAGGLAFAVVISRWSDLRADLGGVPALTQLAPSRTMARRIAAMFRRHAH